jgi:hypothetical protein
MSSGSSTTDLESILQHMHEKRVTFGSLFTALHNTTIQQHEDLLNGIFPEDALLWAFDAIKKKLCCKVNQLTQ